MVRALTVFVALAVLWGTEAHASQCAPPFPFVLPRTTVPEGGELYVFMPVSDRDGIHREQLAAFQRNTLGELWVESASGKPLPFELRRVHSGDVFDVFSLRVKARPGTQFVVQPIQPDFAITVSRRQPRAPLALNIVERENHGFRDALSSDQTRVLIPSLDAPAFRVTWLNGSVVLPGRLMRHPREEAALELELGRIYCAEATAWWKTPTEFTVTALLSDGREVTAAPIVLEPPPSYESVPIRVMH